MAQIIQLPTIPPAVYPDASVELDTAECVMLIAMRWWVSAFRQNEDPLPRLTRGLQAAGASDAAFSIDAVMSIVARSTRRALTVHPPRCPQLATDEKHLLHAAALAQRGDSALAERALRTALLSAHGAEFAQGPLEGLGRLFARARLFFRRRLPPAAAAPGGPEAWPPALFSHSVH